ncbi:MAG: metal-dependent transcriptional regulator [Verrucomicrobiales bacterium]|jgi:DtxR family Mn-dependent transcriptional regulator|nr:metal-dependent transcriptional regulator [Verrucomicrobiales bacterium]
MPSSTVENYLKAILHLQKDGCGSTTVGEIARELAVTPGTVTIMMRHLKERGLVAYEPRRGLSLKPRGVTEAIKVVRRHRLIETFLVEVMGLDWAEVHEEAEILEHVISDRLLDRINEMLGEPTHDPHGDPIPDRNGVFAKDRAMPLVEAAGGRYRVVRVSDEDSALLGWLNEKGVKIGEEYDVSDSDRAAGLLELSRRGGKRFQLGLQVAGQVFVEALP